MTKTFLKFFSRFIILEGNFNTLVNRKIKLKDIYFRIPTF